MSKAIDDIEGFKFVIYSNEGTHKPHIHVKKAGTEIVFELTPEVNVRQIYDMKKQDIKKAWKLVLKNQSQLIKAYYDRHNR